MNKQTLKKLKKIVKDMKSNITCNSCGAVFSKDAVSFKLRRKQKDRRLYKTKHCPYCDSYIRFAQEDPELRILKNNRDKLIQYKQQEQRLGNDIKELQEELDEIDGKIISKEKSSFI